MVWIHGGSFVQGSSSQTPSSGILKNLVSRGVIVVTLNYRLDVFGFLTISDSHRDIESTISTNSIKQDQEDGSINSSDETPPENLGILDMVMALKFVRREIENFGGDPAKITLFGQDSGAVSISLMMRLEKYRKLFSRAILQSGTILGNVIMV